MRVSGIKSLLLLAIPVILSGCELMSKLEKTVLERIDNNKKDITLIEKKQVTVSCGKNKLKKYTDDGWKVISATKEEIVCTWKTERATPGCDIERDKGCRITVPDKMGKQISYQLERKTKKDSLE